jgi:hypothetical protein
MTTNNPVAQPDGVVEVMELLPCPFCGSAASLPDDDVGAVSCENERCAASGIYCSVSEWNTRVPTLDSIAEKSAASD